MSPDFTTINSIQSLLASQSSRPTYPAVMTVYGASDMSHPYQMEVG